MRKEENEFNSTLNGGHNGKTTVELNGQKTTITVTDNSPSSPMPTRPIHTAPVTNGKVRHRIKEIIIIFSLLICTIVGFVFFQGAYKFNPFIPVEMTALNTHEMIISMSKDIFHNKRGPQEITDGWLSSYTEDAVIDSSAVKRKAEGGYRTEYTCDRIFYSGKIYISTGTRYNTPADEITMEIGRNNIFKINTTVPYKKLVFETNKMVVQKLKPNGENNVLKLSISHFTDFLKFNSTPIDFVIVLGNEVEEISIERLQNGQFRLSSSETISHLTISANNEIQEKGIKEIVFNVDENNNIVIN